MGGTVSTCPSPVSSEGGTYSLVGHSQFIHFEILNHGGNRLYLPLSGQLRGRYLQPGRSLTIQYILRF